MPIEPDLATIILNGLNDLKAGQAAILEQLKTQAPPAAAPVTDAETAFLSRWRLVTPAEFKLKYNIEHGQKIAPMTSYDESEAIYRARAGYSTEGYPTRGLTRLETVAKPAIAVIAHATRDTATQFYECGLGKALTLFPDVLAYCFCVGIYDTQKEYGEGLGAGKCPANYPGEGITLELLLRPNFTGGMPGVA